MNKKLEKSMGCLQFYYKTIGDFLIKCQPNLGISVECYIDASLQA